MNSYFTMSITYGYLLFFMVISCAEKPNAPLTNVAEQELAVIRQHRPKTIAAYTDYEKSLLAKGVVDVQQLDGSIAVTLKYATTDNFMGVLLYTDIFHAFLQPEAAAKLVSAQQKLKAKDSTLSLLVYDALRPNSVQHKMWKMVVNTPKQRYVANPYKGSLHNYGCAIDLTITKNGVPIDMGTPYDFFGDKAQPRYNDLFLKRKELTPEQVANRNLLRTVMKAGGFIPMNSEWWHFDAFSKTYIRKRYAMVE